MIQRELCVLVYLGHAAARSHQPGPEVSGPAVPRGLWAAGVCVCFPGLLRNYQRGLTLHSPHVRGRGAERPCWGRRSYSPSPGMQAVVPPHLLLTPPCRKAMHPCTSSLSLEAPGHLNSRVPARTAPLRWLRPTGPQLCSSRQCPHVQCLLHLTSLC